MYYQSLDRSILNSMFDINYRNSDIRVSIFGNSDLNSRTLLPNLEILIAGENISLTTHVDCI